MRGTSLSPFSAIVPSSTSDPQVLYQNVVVYTAFMHVWFHSGSLEAYKWLLPIGIGLAIFLAVEAEKALLWKLKPWPPAGLGMKPEF